MKKATGFLDEKETGVRESDFAPWVILKFVDISKFSFVGQNFQKSKSADSGQKSADQHYFPTEYT